MFKYSLIFLFLASFICKAQVLLPTAATAFEPQHHFNPEVIRIKNIKRITFEIIDKKDFEVAVDKSLTETYEFNGEGLLSRHYYTSVVGSVERPARRGGTYTEYIYDTVSTRYFYSGTKLILRRYHNGLNYYESRYYRYDSLGNVTKELRFKETNNSPDRNIFILGNQVLLSEDSFQYRRFSPTQVKCIFLNNENRPYKEQITNLDSLGRKKNINEVYTAASWIMQEQKFEYSGYRLTRAQFEGNASNRVLLMNTYEYDENKELYTEKQYKNDLLIKEISYVTDRTIGLLNSFVARDPNNKSLRIVKLKYDFGTVGRLEDSLQLGR